MGRAIEKKIEPRCVFDTKILNPRCVFDTKILNHAPIVVHYEIIKTGKVVFSRDEVKRIRYEAMVLSTYLDYRETSDWLDGEFLATVCEIEDV